MPIQGRKNAVVNAVRDLASSGARFTSDDVLTRVMRGAEPTKSDVVTVSMIMHAMCKFSFIKEVGSMRPTERTRGGGRAIIVYEGVRHGIENGNKERRRARPSKRKL